MENLFPYSRMEMAVGLHLLGWKALESYFLIPVWSQTDWFGMWILTLIWMNSDNPNKPICVLYFDFKPYFVVYAIDFALP